MSGLKYNRRVVEILLLCLVAVTMINVAIVLAKHAEDGIKQKQIKSEQLFDKVDSSYSKSDTIELEIILEVGPDGQITPKVL